MKAYLLCSFLLSAAALGTSPPNVGPKEVIQSLLQNKDVKLKGLGCETSMGSTVGEYLSYLLGTLASARPTDTVKLTAVCEALVKGKPSQTCEVMAYVLDQARQSPWTRGLKFKRTVDGKTIEAGALRCMGA